MKLSKNLRASLLLALAAQIAVPTFSPMMAHALTAEAKETNAQLAALTEAERINLQLLVMATIVEQQTGGLIAVDPKIAEKYETFRKVYLGSVPTSVVGGLATYLGYGVSKKVEFVSAPITAALRASATIVKKGSQKVGDGIEWSSRVTGLDKVLEKSSTASANSFEHVIVPILEIFINKHTGLSSAFASTAGIAAGSSFAFTKNTNEAMSYEQARTLLGYDKELNARIDKIVGDMSELFALSETNRAKIRDSIRDEAVSQLNNKAYKLNNGEMVFTIDILKVMTEKGIITQGEAQAVDKLRALSSDLASTATAGDVKQVTAENASSILALAAMLETQLESGRVTDARTRAQLLQMLGSLHLKLKRIDRRING